MHGGVPQKRGLSLVHVRTENRMALPCCVRQKRLTGKKNSATVRLEDGTHGVSEGKTLPAVPAPP